MAEINIEQKKRSNLLPLIIVALLVIALLVWFFNRSRVADGPATTSSRGGAVATPVGTALSAGDVLSSITRSAA